MKTDPLGQAIIAATIALTGLKLTGFIHWSWIWILSPIWLYAALCLVAALIIVNLEEDPFA